VFYWRLLICRYAHYALRIGAPLCGRSLRTASITASGSRLPRERSGRRALLNTSGCQVPCLLLLLLLFWCTQTFKYMSPRLRVESPPGVAAWQFNVAGEPHPAAGMCCFFPHAAGQPRLQEPPGDRDQAPKTSRSNRCLLTYTDRLIYDTLRKSFIFHHL